MFQTAQLKEQYIALPAIADIFQPETQCERIATAYSHCHTSACGIVSPTMAFNNEEAASKMLLADILVEVVYDFGA
jgi:hypothetical protein